jgi:hypothetical protein
MKRVPITFLVLSVMGGCMAIAPDPIEDSPYGPPPRSPAQARAWSYQPQSAKTVAKDTSDKAENTLVKAAYTEIKPAENESPPINLGMLRLTNSKRITFRYEVNEADPAAAANLEIWGTTDMHNWKKYHAVSRPPSSLAVEVKDEGLYAFTMLARGKDESAKNPPAGEPPQVWVAVDLTKPVVQLIDTEVNVRTRTPTLIVRWNAKDRNFGPQPITLLYAERPEGPWQPIAANLENSGRYEGPLPPRLTDNVYVRVQASDLMGNVGMSQTTALRIPSWSSIDAARAPQSAVSILSVDGK